MDDCLDKWIDLKNQISKLEKQLNIQKNSVKSYMNENDLYVLKNSKNSIEVTRTKSSSTRISKQDVPEEIWTEYAQVNVYDVFNIKNINIKNTKLNRSRKIN